MITYMLPFFLSDGMAEILWTSYQVEHIERRHNIIAEEFEEAWLDRDEHGSRVHPEYGAYFEGYGFTDAGRCLYLVWRWQNQDEESEEVWPITAFEPDED
jgi:hypothetical protein